MPTKREREYYRQGFLDGQSAARIRPEMMAGEAYRTWSPADPFIGSTGIRYGTERDPAIKAIRARKPKRKLSAWNKYVKANSKKPRFRYRNGKLNLKKMAVAFRKTPAGRKKKRR